MNNARIANLLDRQKRYFLTDVFHAGCVAALIAPMIAALTTLA
jgi:hypothetical protein